MTLIVQKFRGTSVRNIGCIHIVAEKNIQTRSGHKVIIVVSAMAGETDLLIQLAQELSNFPNPRELNVLLSTEEQVAIALLERGCSVRSYTGPQVPIRTDSIHNKAHILEINVSNIQEDLAAEKVVVVTDFQGADEMENITTLGRDGSDTTEVVLASVLKTDEYQIYTDVSGIHTTDPKAVLNARKTSEITVNEVLELSSSGSKIIQNRATELASINNVPVHILSTFLNGPGTLIVCNKMELQETAATSIAFNRDEVKFMILSIPNSRNTLHIKNAV